jgi:acetyl-CoA carboxylase biotin carboxyl carrier protein
VAMNDFEYLERLLDLLNRSSAESIEIRTWSKTFRVSKSGGTNHARPVTYVASPNLPPSAAPSATRAAGGGREAAEATSAATQLLEIKSPMVGTFYARPEPGAEAYVRVGSRIAPGQTLCIIEAMKIMNPLDAEIAGVIREVCVEDAQPVEFGHVLFRVDPNG